MFNSTKKQKQLIILKILYPFWLLFSFTLPYYLITSGCPSWRLFFPSFLYYLIFLQPVSTLGIAYILAEGEWRKVKSKLRIIMSTAVILIVLAFTMIQWTTITTIYGHYGSYSKRATSPEIQFLIPGSTAMTDFENATLYREALKNKYDIMFKEIWTFGLITFASFFLLLYAMGKRERGNN